jgi:hypothetical protein
MHWGAHKSFAKHLMHDRCYHVLLRNATVYFRRDDNRVRRDSEGILRDGFANFAQGYFCSKCLAMVDDWLLVTVIDVNCSEDQKNPEDRGEYTYVQRYGSCGVAPECTLQSCCHQPAGAQPGMYCEKTRRSNHKAVGSCHGELIHPGQ